jgi:hypothetical protein
MWRLGAVIRRLNRSEGHFKRREQCFQLGQWACHHLSLPEARLSEVLAAPWVHVSRMGLVGSRPAPANRDEAFSPQCVATLLFSLGARPVVEAD